MLGTLPSTIILALVRAERKHDGVALRDMSYLISKHPK